MNQSYFQQDFNIFSTIMDNQSEGFQLSTYVEFWQGNFFTESEILNSFQNFSYVGDSEMGFDNSDSIQSQNLYQEGENSQKSDMIFQDLESINQSSQLQEVSLGPSSRQDLPPRVEKKKKKRKPVSDHMKNLLPVSSRIHAKYVRQQDPQIYKRLLQTSSSFKKFCTKPDRQSFLQVYKIKGLKAIWEQFFSQNYLIRELYLTRIIDGERRKNFLENLPVFQVAFRSGSFPFTKIRCFGKAKQMRKLTA